MGKSFKSSQLFQRNWTNTDALPSRVWKIEHKDSAQQRVAKLHDLLAAKKNYKEHLRVAKEHANEIKDAYTAHAQELKDRTNAVEEKLHQEAVTNRARMRRALSEHAATCESKQAAITQRIREQEKEYKDACGEMQERVGQLPKIWGKPPARPNPEDVERRHSAAAEAMRDRKVAYRQRMAAIKADLDKRTEPRSPVSKEAPDATAPQSQKREEEVRSMKATSREYEEFLDTLYKKHSDRIQSNRQQTQEWRKALPMWAPPPPPGRYLQDANVEMQGRLEAIAGRSRKIGALGGYKPVKKSARRLREDAAIADNVM